MLKNITFSADADLIKKARKIAEENNTTLNDEFRRWIDQYANRPATEKEFLDLISRMSYVRVGKHFTREEMNER